LTRALPFPRMSGEELPTRAPTHRPPARARGHHRMSDLPGEQRGSGRAQGRHGRRPLPHLPRRHPRQPAAMLGIPRVSAAGAEQRRHSKTQVVAPVGGLGLSGRAVGLRCPRRPMTCRDGLVVWRWVRTALGGVRYELGGQRRADPDAQRPAGILRARAREARSACEHLLGGLASQVCRAARLVPSATAAQRGALAVRRVRGASAAASVAAHVR